VSHDDAAMVASFVMRGANVDGYDRDGNTPLLRAGYSLKHASVHMSVYYSLHTQTLLITVTATH